MNRGESDGELRMVADSRGGVIFAPRQAPDLVAAWFDPGFWRARDALREMAGGRGGVQLVATPAGAAFLRHYRRGGMAARFSRDRFLWAGVARVRSVREFRLLHALYRAGLPVPQPLGGAWQREGWVYRADLLTLALPHTRSLAAMIVEAAGEPGLAGAVGACIGRFHARGVRHADLNAHNILVDGDGVVSLIDFDRGEQRAPRRAWQTANLRRLHRSLEKVSRTAGLDPGWIAHWWPAFHAAWAAEVGA